MRTFKFRSFDESENKFWYFTLQEVLERRMGYRGSWDTKIMQGKKMQGTEINDSFGNEIYEADIVNVVEPLVGGRESNFIGIVKFDEGSWWVDNAKEAIQLFDECNDIEILGNIYENKDLIDKYRLNEPEII